INLAYLSGYYATKKNGTFGASLRYFSMGDITFTDINGNSLGQFRPNEFALDIAYARKLSKTFSIGGAARYVNSNLTGGGLYAGAVTHPGRTVAADISATYRSQNGAIPRCGLPASGLLQPACEKFRLSSTAFHANAQVPDGALSRKNVQEYPFAPNWCDARPPS